MPIHYPLRNQKDVRVYYCGDSKDDRSPYGQTGTLVDGASVDTGALVLNGTSQYLTYPDAASNSLLNELTLFAWFNVDTLDAVSQEIINKYDYGDNNRAFRLIINSVAGDVISVFLSSDGTNLDLSASTTETISTDTDYFVVFTWDGSRYKIYIDGNEKLSGFYSAGIFDSDERISIGSFFDSDVAKGFFDGTIYQAGVMGRALSSQQILDLYLLGKNYRIIEPNKELLFYENFRGGRLPANWTVVSGSFAIEIEENTGEYYLSCVTAGVIGIPVPQEMQDLTKGGFEWEWDMYKEGGSNITRCRIISDVIGEGSTGNGYYFRFESDEQVGLVEFSGSGTLMADSSASFINIQTWYTCKVTRSQDTAGQFTVYLDGTLVDVTGGSGTNPATDTTHTTTKYLVLDLDTGDRVKNIRIRRF